ncbi:hypothetical protein Bca101_009898 [Brassica carinata]
MASHLPGGSASSRFRIQATSCGAMRTSAEVFCSVVVEVLSLRTEAPFSCLRQRFSVLSFLLKGSCASPSGVAVLSLAARVFC